MKFLLPTAQVVAAIAVVLSLASHGAREGALGFFLGLSQEADLFRAYSVVPFAVVGLLTESYLTVVLPYLSSAKESTRSEIAFRSCAFVVAFGAFLYVVSLPLQWRYLHAGENQDGSFSVVSSMTFYIVLFLSVCAYRARCAIDREPVKAIIFVILVNGLFVSGLLGIYIFFPINITSTLLTWLMAFSCGVSVLVVVWISCMNHAPLRFIPRYSGDSKYRMIYTGILVLISFKVLNVIPRFIDRAVLVELDFGFFAAYEISIFLISAPVTLVTMVYTYTVLPHSNLRKNSGSHVYKLILGILVGAVALTITVGGIFSIDRLFQVQFGELDLDSMLILKEILQPHSVSVGLLFSGIMLAVILIQVDAYRSLFIAVLVKILVKVFFIFFYFENISARDVAFTLSISEAALCASLLVSTLIIFSTREPDAQKS